MSAKSTVINEAKEGPAGKGDRPQAGVKHTAVKGGFNPDRRGCCGPWRSVLVAFSPDSFICSMEPSCM